MAIQKSTLREEWTEGQNLFCQLRPDSGRFYSCKLDGEKLLMPTDAISLDDMGNNSMRVEHDKAVVNLASPFPHEESKIKVKCGWTKEDSVSDEVDEFCVLEVRGV
jgi:hypothetical protein